MGPLTGGGVRERVYESSRVYCVHSWLQGSIYIHISGLCKGEAALNLFNKLDLTTFKPLAGTELYCTYYLNLSELRSIHFNLSSREAHKQKGA